MKELEKVVQEIKQGKRLILFPPGILTLPAVVITTIGALVTCSGPLVEMLGAELDLGTKAVLQLLSIIPLLIGVVIPGLMISAGKKQYANRLRQFLALLIAVSAAGLIGSLFTTNDRFTISLSVSLALSGLAYYITRTGQFLLLCEFMHLLKGK